MRETHCDAGKSCAGCPDVTTCDYPDAYNVAGRQMAPGGSMDSLLLQALERYGTSVYDLWHSLGDVGLTAARRICFDGANPADVLALFYQAYLLGMLQENPQSALSRTGTDPDAYLASSPPALSRAWEPTPGAWLSAKNMFSSPKGVIFFRLPDGQWIRFDTELEEWFWFSATCTVSRIPAHPELFAKMLPTLQRWLGECAG